MQYIVLKNAFIFEIFFKVKKHNEIGYSFFASLHTPKRGLCILVPLLGGVRGGFEAIRYSPHALGKGLLKK
jgi:hypothetical protein